MYVKTELKQLLPSINNPNTYFTENFEDLSIFIKLLLCPQAF